MFCHWIGDGLALHTHIQTYATRSRITCEWRRPSHSRVYVRALTNIVILIYTFVFYVSTVAGCVIFLSSQSRARLHFQQMKEKKICRLNQMEEHDRK